MPPDAFALHPELRGLISDPDRSTMRGFDPQAYAATRPDLGLDAFLTPPAEREASRRATLAGVQGDLWVFGYGSLMWDSAFRFVELRRAHVADHARRFILKDTFGARGTAERPGLLAALDHGAGCDGLVFRIAADDVAQETEILWRREMAGPAYHPAFVNADTAAGQVRALAFTADHASQVIVGDVSRADQVRFIATGAGFFGSSLDYLSNIASHFAVLGIRDAEVDRLMDEVAAYLSDHSDAEGRWDRRKDAS
jgi:glutathione-specific gamma-glutamylcyclotransferase